MSRTGASDRASRSAQAGVTYSGRTSPTAGWFICWTTSLPSGLAAATAWHSAGSSRSSASPAAALMSSSVVWATPCSNMSSAAGRNAA